MTCHDCDTEKGNLHYLGCDYEECPFCGNQLIACSCAYHLFDLDSGLNELTPAQNSLWLLALKNKGRIPYGDEVLWSKTTCRQISDPKDYLAVKDLNGQESDV